MHLNALYFLSKLTLLIPIAFITWGVSTLQKKDRKNTVAILLIIGSCTWIFFIIRNVVLYSNLLRNIFESLPFLYDTLSIMMPIGILILATFLFSNTSQTEQTADTPE